MNVFVAAANLVSGSTLTVAANSVGGMTSDQLLIVQPDSGGTSGGYSTWAVNTTGSNFLLPSAGGHTGASTFDVTGSGTTQIDSDGTSWGSLNTVSLAGESGSVFITGADGGVGYTVNSPAGLLTVSVLASYTGGSGNDIVDLSSMTRAELQSMTTLNGGTGTTETLIVSHVVATAGGGSVITPLTNFQVIGDAGGAGGTITMANFPGVAGVELFANETAPLTINDTGGVAGGTFSFIFNQFSGGGLAIDGPSTGSNILGLQVGASGFFETGAANTLTNTRNINDSGFATVNITAAGSTGGTDLIGSGVGNALTVQPNGEQAVTVTFAGSDSVVLNAGIALNGGNGTTINDLLSGELTLAAVNAGTINAATSGGLLMTAPDTAATAGSSGGDAITGSTSKLNVSRARPAMTR